MNLLQIICNCYKFLSEYCQNVLGKSSLIMNKQTNKKGNYIWDNENVNTCKYNQSVNYSKTLSKSLIQFYELHFIHDKSQHDSSRLYVTSKGKKVNMKQGLAFKMLFFQPQERTFS